MDYKKEFERWLKVQIKVIELESKAKNNSTEELLLMFKYKTWFEIKLAELENECVNIPAPSTWQPG